LVFDDDDEDEVPPERQPVALVDPPPPVGVRLPVQSDAEPFVVELGGPPSMRPPLRLVGLSASC